MHIPETYIVIDTETTGLPEQDKRGNKDFSAPRVIEIGALKCGQYHRFSAKFSTLVKPWTKEEFEKGVSRASNVFYLTEKVMQLTGITESMIENYGVFAGEAARRLMDFLGYDPNESGTWTQRPLNGEDPRLIVVGHNVLGFDLPLLCRIVDLPQVSEVYDTMLIWRAWSLGMRKGEWESLDHFYGRVGAERMNGHSNLEFCLRTLCGPIGLRAAGFVDGGKHRAINDCCAAHLLFVAMSENGIIEEVLGR